MDFHYVLMDFPGNFLFVLDDFGHALINFDFLGLEVHDAFGGEVERREVPRVVRTQINPADKARRSRRNKKLEEL